MSGGCKEPHVQNKLINFKFLKLKLVSQTNPETLEIAQKMSVNKHEENTEDQETDAGSRLYLETKNVLLKNEMFDQAIKYFCEWHR